MRNDLLSALRRRAFLSPASLCTCFLAAFILVAIGLSSSSHQSRFPRSGKYSVYGHTCIRGPFPTGWESPTAWDVASSATGWGVAPCAAVLDGNAAVTRAVFRQGLGRDGRDWGQEGRVVRGGGRLGGLAFHIKRKRRNRGRRALRARQTTHSPRGHREGR